MGLHDNKK